MSCRSAIGYAALGLAGLIGLFAAHGCAMVGPRAAASSRAPGFSAQAALDTARLWEDEALEQSAAGASPEAWMRCALWAHAAMASERQATATSAAALATSCSQAAIDAIARNAELEVRPGLARLGGRTVRIEFRGLPDSLGAHLRLQPATQVSVEAVGGVRYQRPGFGVSYVASAPRCTDRPICSLYPPEGIFRPVTVWLEGTPGDDTRQEAPILVVQSPITLPEHVAGTQHYRLAEDTSAPYVLLLQRTRLRRLAWWGLIGGEEVGRRSGAFLLDDYDPAKVPIIMIHGLASSPVIWARLSNAIMGDADLHRHYQIWHVVYQTNGPLLVDRYRVQSYLDTAWRILDPAGKAPARQGAVLIGHSLGGVIARLLCSASVPALWNAAFTVPLAQLHGSAADLALLGHVFEFKPYPGVDEAIFMAAPNHGSPEAGLLLGRLAQDLAWRHIPELAALRRLTIENPQAVRSELRSDFRLGRVSSVSTLLPDQPVSLIDAQLLPVAGVRYHTIAGVLPGTNPPSDGYVPLSSALLPGAASTLIVDSNHRVPDNPQAVAAVLAILRQHEQRH